MFHKRAFFLLLPFLMSACALPFRELDPEPVPVQGQPAATPFQTPAPLKTELTPDITFNLLAGEVAARQEKVQDAFNHYRKAATLTGDPSIAERAAKIALFIKDKKAAQEAVAYWIERDPNDLESRQFAVAVALYADNYDQAKLALVDLIKVAEAKGEDGFLLAARVLGKSQDGKRGLNLMRGLTKAHRYQPEAWHALALMAAEVKSLSQAQKAIIRAVALKPDWQQAQVLKGKIFWFANRRDESLELLGKLVAQYPKDADLRHTYARFLIQAQRHEEAFKEFQQLWKDAGDQGEGADEVRFTLGVLALQLKHREEAVAHFTALLGSPRQRSQSSYFLGRIAEEQGDNEAAIKWYGDVDEGDYELDANLRIAERLAASKRLTEARERLASARSRWPEHAVRIYVLESGLLKEAKVAEEEVWRLFETALKGHPDDHDLLYSRALFGAAKGKLDILERDLRAILKKDPKHADALNALGYTLSDLTGRQEEAMGYIRQALDLKPDSPAILDSMGWVHYRSGHMNEALDFLRKANDKLHDPEIAAHLGEVLWESGKQEEAREVWKRAWDKFSGNDILSKTLQRFGVRF